MKDYRQLPQLHAIIKGFVQHTLAGCPVAEHTDRYPVVVVILIGKSNAGAQNAICPPTIPCPPKIFFSLEKKCI